MSQHSSNSFPAALVSVVTPSRNQAGFLEETLASVYAQDYRPIEHIVIDGASNDGTVDILRRWADSHQSDGYRLTWTSEPDRGHGDALNKGFARVTGDFVGWLNSDDVYFDRKAVRLAVAALQKHSEVDVVFGEVALISEDSGLQMVWCFPKFRYERAVRGYLIPQPTVFFRRCVTDRHRLDSNLKVATDHAYWLIIGREHRFLKIGRIQAADRDHAMRQTHRNEALWRRAKDDLRKKYGSEKVPGTLAKYHDLAWKAIMRLNGFRYALSLIFNSQLRGDALAYPGWIDDPKKLLLRQLTMRLGRRTSLLRN
jgi:glycosyltransferase involved in cell wall biosynthesis